MGSRPPLVEDDEPVEDDELGAVGFGRAEREDDAFGSKGKSV